MYKILLVEDDENIREIENIALKNSGHEVIAFENAKSFYKRKRHLHRDLLSGVLQEAK